MLLKEVDLDAPDLPRSARSAFRYKARCTAALFQRLLPRLKTESQWKILVNCVNRSVSADVRDEHELYSVEVGFDFEAFDRADNHTKKKITLDTLLAGLRRVCQTLGWNYELFEAIAAKIVGIDYQNVWTWSKKASPDRKHIAVIECRHEVDEFMCFAVIQERGGAVVTQKLLFTELPDEFNFKLRLGDLSWESNEAILFESKHRTESWRVSVRTS